MIVCGLFICGLSSCAGSFILFKIRSVFEQTEEGLECVSWFLIKFAWNISYFKKNGRNITINPFNLFKRYATCLSNFQKKILNFLHKSPRNFQTLNFNNIRRVEPELLQSERRSWRSKQSNVLNLQNRPTLWLGFLVSCNRHCSFKSRNRSAIQT